MTKDFKMASGAGSKKKGQEGWKWSVDEKPVKIDKWDGNAVKNALDDGAKKVLTESLGYQEDHTLTDTRLAICTLSVVFALIALGYDYLNPFPASRPVLILCVVSYFVLMGILTLFTTFKEKNYILFAVQKDNAGIGPDHIWTLRSVLKRYDQFYTLTMSFRDGETKKERELELSKSVASWFDHDGVLIPEFFERDVMELHRSLSSEKKEN